MELTLRPLPGTSTQLTQGNSDGGTALSEPYYLLLKSIVDVVTETLVAYERQEMTTSDVVPTTDDIPENAFTVWKNTTTPDVRLYVNDAGTLKSVVLS